MNETTHYAHCTKPDCGKTFDNREDAQKHSSDTLDAAKIENPNWSGSISGHGFQVDNPTDEERRANRVRSAVSWAIESAVDRFIESMERDVDRGEITAEEVREELRGHYDFADAWDEYMAEVDA